LEVSDVIRQVAHLCFDSDNPLALVEFYSSKLGLPVKFTLKTKEGQDFGYFIACGNSTFLEIFDRALKIKVWGGELKPLERGNQYQHYCFEVTALREFKAKLESAGVKVGPITTGMSKNLQCWINDPDGNSIELMEYTAESFHMKPGMEKA
jgi:catechol 2,3-dioxygenase-like lactoylglutathione lyase family enzyme